MSAALEAPSATLAARAARLPEQVRNLPPLPKAALDALTALRDDDSSLDHCASLIARDPALTAQLMRLANSSFYGVPGRVSGVGDAMLLLGRRTVLSLVTLAAVAKQFNVTSDGLFSVSCFWRHALGTALASATIARLLHLDDASAFTGGLLHDIGRLALAAYLPDAEDEAIRESRAGDERLGAVEARLLGTGHDTLGACVATSWKFPPAVAQAIASHHAPLAAAGGGASLADVVHAADAVVHALDLADDPNEAVPEIDGEAWARLEMTPRMWLQVFRDTETGVAALRSAMQL